MTVASDARKPSTRQPVRMLPSDCPYCQEMLQEVSLGWVCHRCRSTLGAENHINRAEKRVEESRR